MLALAEDCARKAAEAPSEESRKDYLQLQQHWLNLAQSYNFTEQLHDFSKESIRRRAELCGEDKQYLGSPPPPSPPDNPQPPTKRVANRLANWRDRAQKLGALAKTTKDIETKERMSRLAKEYETFADEAELGANGKVLRAINNSVASKGLGDWMQS